MRKQFIIIESIIYLSFLVLDILKIDSDYIKYLGIIFCFVNVLYNKKKYQCISMFFTLIADYFLLILLDHYEIGVSSFIFAQITYIYFLGNIDKSYFKVFLFIRGFVIIAGTLVLNICSSLTLLNELVLIYFSNLVLNCIQAYLTQNKKLAIGLTLFVCCDICVGLFNINAANSVAAFLMWFFYLPSQVLICLA